MAGKDTLGLAGGGEVSMMHYIIYMCPFLCPSTERGSYSLSIVVIHGALEGSRGAKAPQ